MSSLLATVDALLRGRLTSRERLEAGHVDAPARTLAVVGLVLGMIYGVGMGAYGALRPENPAWTQVLASAVKVPLLFLLTLVVTFPSLYVVSALFDSRLRYRSTLRLLLAAMGIHLALLASLAPVTVFFTLSTESYDFIKVLNVFFFAIGGFAGLMVLRRALDAVFGGAGERFAPRSLEHRPVSQSQPPSGESGEKDGSDHEAPVSGDPVSGDPVSGDPVPLGPPVRVRTGAAPRRVFQVWVVIYGMVGAQMGWILRPFIGSPELEFTFFRERESNFFQAFFRALGNLFT